MPQSVPHTGRRQNCGTPCWLLGQWPRGRRDNSTSKACLCWAIMGSQTNINTDTGDSMEAQFTVRDKPQSFADWVNSYGMAKQTDFVPQGLWHLVDGRWIEHPVGNAGLIRFTVDVVEPELLDVRAVTRWKWDDNAGQWLTENDELNAYFAELVRAIRLKWVGDNDSSPLSTEQLKDRQYWTDIYRHAQASGNIRAYLSRLEIPRSSYYDAIKEHGLSGVSRKAGHNSDTEPDT